LFNGPYPLLIENRLLPKLRYNFGSAAAGWSLFAFKLQTNHRKPLIYSGKSWPQLKNSKNRGDR